MKIDTSYQAKSCSYSSIPRSTSAIKYIVIHYTGNKGDKAASNAKYFAYTNTRSAGAHYFVGADGIYRSIKPTRTAWAVGGSKYPNTAGAKMYGKITNKNSISVEMCDSVSSVPEVVRLNTTALVCYLMKKYNIPISNVYRHYDVTGKFCPASLVGQDSWNKFKSQLKIAYNAGVNLKCSVVGTVKKAGWLYTAAGDRVSRYSANAIFEVNDTSVKSIRYNNKLYKMYPVIVDGDKYYIKKTNVKLY